MGGWLGRWKNVCRWIYGWVDGWNGKWVIDRWIGGRLSGGLDDELDRWVGGWVVGRWMCIWMYECICACVCICVCASAYVCMDVDAYICGGGVCMCIHGCMCMYVYVHMSDVCMYVCVCVNASIYIYMYICMSVSVFMYVCGMYLINLSCLLILLPLHQWFAELWSIWLCLSVHFTIEIQSYYIFLLLFLKDDSLVLLQILYPACFFLVLKVLPKEFICLKLPNESPHLEIIWFSYSLFLLSVFLYLRTLNHAISLFPSIFHNLLHMISTTFTFGE